MINSGFRAFIKMVASRPSHSLGAGSATIAVLVLCIFSIPIGSILYIIILLRRKQYKAAIITLVEMFLAMFYFFGANIGHLVGHYGKVLKICDQGPECAENTRIVATISLVIANMLFELVCPLIQVFAKLTENNENNERPQSGDLLLIIILKTDALLTIVVINAQKMDFCSTAEISVNTILFLVISFVSILVIIAYCKLGRKQGEPSTIPKGIICCVLIPVYVLADNLQPLDCYWGCDTFAANATQNDLNCNNSGNSGLRLGFTGFSFILFVILLYNIYKKPATERTQQSSSDEGSSSHDGKSGSAASSTSQSAINGPPNGQSDEEESASDNEEESASGNEEASALIPPDNSKVRHRNNAD